MMTAINADDEHMVRQLLRFSGEYLAGATGDRFFDDDLDYIPSALTVYNAAFRALTGCDATTDEARSIAALAHNLRTCELLEGDFPHPWGDEVRCIHDEAYAGALPEGTNEGDDCPHTMISPNS